MLRVSWRPGDATLVVDGIVDFEHHAVLTVAVEAALDGNEHLVVDLLGAHCDNFGRLAIDLMERTVTARAPSTLKLELRQSETPRAA